MPQLYDNKYLLGLEDTDIQLEEHFLEKRTIKGEVWHIIHGKLSPEATVCKACGCANGAIRKNGTKTVKVHMLPTQGYKTLMELKKQRYYCPDCHGTFIAETYFVKRNGNLSRPLIKGVLLKLQETRDINAIAREVGISHQSVRDILYSTYPFFKQSYSYLPEFLCFDEFKSTKHADGVRV